METYRIRSLAALFVAAVALAGCGRSAGTAGPRLFGAGAERAGAETFSGKLPCRDCDGYRLTLTLFPDGTFRMRRSALGDAPDPGASRLDLGRWEVEPKGSDRLVMQGATVDLLWFRIVDPDHLRMLATGGFEPNDDRSVTLEREATVDPIGDRMRLKGMLVYRADAAVLTECSTAEPLPIFPGAAFPDAERAYLGAAVAPETPVFAEVEARFEERAPEPGVPPREGIVVDSVVSVDPNGSCGTSKR